eukprot:scaffold37826_cov219-Skeletonema_marinoi.AAC.7
MSSGIDNATLPYYVMRRCNSSPLQRRGKRKLYVTGKFGGMQLSRPTRDPGPTYAKIKQLIPNSSQWRHINA